MTVHPASVYAGVHPAQYVASVGSAAEIDLVSADDDGTVLSGQALRVRVYDRRWITNKADTPRGRRVHRSGPRDTLAETPSATADGKGLAPLAYPPRQSGLRRSVA